MGRHARERVTAAGQETWAPKSGERRERVPAMGKDGLLQEDIPVSAGLGGSKLSRITR